MSFDRLQTCMMVVMVEVVVVRVPVKHLWRLVVAAVVLVMMVVMVVVPVVVVVVGTPISAPRPQRG